MDKEIGWIGASSRETYARNGGAALIALLLALPSLAAPPKPSRPASKGCAWEKVSDEKVGLAAWVERCDYGFRKIDFFPKGRSLFMRYSDGGEPEPVVDVFDLKPGEAPEAGMRRVFDEHTDKKLAARCVLAPLPPDRGWTKPRAGVARYTFVPDAPYAKEVAAMSSPDEVGEPPCGEWGDAPDGIQYFEAQRGARRILFVRVGQDEPLFDEKTLRALPKR